MGVLGTQLKPPQLLFPGRVHVIRRQTPNANDPTACIYLELDWEDQGFHSLSNLDEANGF